MIKQLLRLFWQRPHNTALNAQRAFPHLVKQRMLQHYLAENNIHTLLEINTFPGVAQAGQTPEERIIAAEISENLYIPARKRPFSRATVELLWGASRKVLNQLDQHIQQPVICWLDGHYNTLHEKICPIFEQLEVLFTSAGRHIFLINNAAQFNGQDGWPALEAVVAFLKNKDCRYQVRIQDNVIIAGVNL